MIEVCQKIVEPEPLSPICPKCGKEIEYLINYQSGEEISNFDGVDYSDFEFEGDGQTDDYVCPECRGVLFTDEEEAKEFLKR